MASHAQKHFIKLCLKGERLPAKVAESGTGYTLSGKALDPESAAAKAYGFKSGVLESAIDLHHRFVSRLIYMDGSHLSPNET